MTIKSWMYSIMDEIKLEQGLFAIELKKNAIFDIVYSLASTIFNQSVLNLVKIYIIIKSWMNLIMVLIEIE